MKSEHSREFTKQKTNIAFGIAILCLVIPFLCRIPRGMDWVVQYFPYDRAELPYWFLLFGSFALLPAIVVFVSVWLSNQPFYYPGMFATATALFLLIYWHHDNNIADAQGTVTLIYIPVFVAWYSFLGGILGLLIQWAIGLAKRRE